MNRALGLIALCLAIAFMVDSGSRICAQEPETTYDKLDQAEIRRAANSIRITNATSDLDPAIIALSSRVDTRHLTVRRSEALTIEGIPNEVFSVSVFGGRGELIEPRALQA